eukprot:TRINITY_DN7913_c0_g1_i1.p1 TRINITY_DN7913_c0_g1~~TRINITY_DN7913_c0_g1_i1.p1  ORF type:complete len:1046 (-),score=339.10 TRINITY_DN7913_c0_g1_i1:117-3254(-)
MQRKQRCLLGPMTRSGCWSLNIKLKRKKKSAGGSVLATPKYYMTLLRSTANSKDLKALRLTLNSEGVSWVKEFLDLGGLAPVVNALESSLKSLNQTSNDGTEEECVLSLKAIMNTGAGLNAVIGNSAAVNALALSAAHDNKTTKATVFGLLAALCLVPPDGHSAVTAALENVKKVRREKTRFYYIMQNLKTYNDSLSVDEYVSAGMKFLNAYVGTPAEIEDRMRLRAEFFNLGVDVMEEQYKGMSPEMDALLASFNEMMEDDNNELAEQYDDVNIQDPVDVIGKVNTLVPSTQKSFFLSIMRSMYVVAKNSSMFNYWGIIDAHILDVIHNRNDQSQDSAVKKFQGLASAAAQNEELADENKRLKAQLDRLRGGVTGMTSSMSKSRYFGRADLESREPLSPIQEGSGSFLQTSSSSSSASPATETGSSEFDNKISKLVQERTALEEKCSKLLQEKMALEEQVTTARTLTEELKQSVANAEARASSSPSDASTSAPPPSSDASTEGDSSVPEPPSGGPPPPGGGPPPPPPPPGGGPPPPPPPPGGGPPPPPPPGGKLGSKPAAPAKPPGPVPKVKMVQFNWKKLGTNVSAEDTFWGKATDKINDIKGEFDTLEELFGAKKPAAKPTDGAAAEDSKAPAKPTVVSLLDPKRTQAISIFLSRVKLSNRDIKEAILNMDSSRVAIEDLKNLLKNVPTAEEIEMLKSYQDDVSQLGKPEHFFLEIMDIPRLSAKLESFIFMLQFNTQADELMPDILTIKNASISLKNSQKLAKILELVLAVGNYINGGTFRGGLTGFKLESLLAMSDMKSPADPKLSLAGFFARLLREKYPDLLNFYSDISAVDQAKRISLQTITAEVASLKKSLRATMAEAEASKTDEYGIVAGILNKFLVDTTINFETLEQEATEAQTSFTDVVTFYGEDPKTTTPEEFFALISKFGAVIEQAHKDAATEKERQEKESKRAAAAAQKKSTVAGKITSPSAAAAAAAELMKGNEDSTGIMDNLASDLKGDMIKNTIKAARIRAPGARLSVGPNVAAEAMNIVLRKTGARG